MAFENWYGSVNRVLESSQNMRYESSSSDVTHSPTDDFELEDIRRVFLFREDVMAILPKVRRQLSYFEQRYPFIECSNLKDIWDLIKIIQNVMDHRGQFHQVCEIEEYEDPGESIDALKEQLRTLQIERNEIWFELFNAQEMMNILTKEGHKLEAELKLSGEQSEIKYKQYERIIMDLERQLNLSPQKGLWFERKTIDTNHWENESSFLHTKDQLRLDADKLRYEKQQLYADLRVEQKSKDIIEKQKTRISELENKLKLLQNDLFDKKEMGKKQKVVIKELNEYKKNVDQLRQKNETLLANLQIKEQTIVELEQLLKTNSDIAASPDGAVKKIRHYITPRTNQESKDNTTLEEAYHELKREVEMLQLKNKRLSNTLLEEKKIVEEVKEENTKLFKMLTQTNEEKAKLRSADEKHEMLRKTNSELESKVRQLLTDKKKTMEDFIHERNSENEKVKVEHSQLMEKNHKLQIDIDEMSRENRFLNEKIMSANENLKTKENEFQNEVQKLQNDKKTLTENLMRANEIVKKNETYGNTYLQKINETLQKDVDQLQNQNRQLNDNLKLEKKMAEEYNFKILDMQRVLETKQQEVISLKEKLVESTARTGKVNSMVNTKSNQDIQQQLKDTKDQLKHVQKELDDTKSRLSRAMGDKLTDNNPNIADLSDKNRPTKISERYQELYDNQWTDAFEIINVTCMNEENTINVLRSVLMDTLEYCKEQAANQMIQIKHTFLKGEEIPANVIKQVKECRKAMAELYGKGLYKDYCAQLGRSVNASLAMKTPNYVKECFEICWLMAVQDPPVVFGPQLRRNDAFNKDQYKAYTKGGDRVEFVVWPVLLLHQNGPVLCKGVAQGK